ncbi:hypothetical protein QQ045_028552 [Rhodiola kirilowii]
MLCPPRLLASVLLGYDIGVMSGAIIFIQKDLKLTDVQIEILAGILSLYSLLGAFAAGRTSDYIGRRYTIVIAGLFFLAGSIFHYTILHPTRHNFNSVAKDLSHNTVYTTTL